MTCQNLSYMRRELNSRKSQVSFWIYDSCAPLMDANIAPSVRFYVLKAMVHLAISPTMTPICISSRDQWTHYWYLRKYD